MQHQKKRDHEQVKQRCFRLRVYGVTQKQQRRGGKQEQTGRAEGTLWVRRAEARGINGPEHRIGGDEFTVLEKNAPASPNHQKAAIPPSASANRSISRCRGAYTRFSGAEAWPEEGAGGCS